MTSPLYSVCSAVYATLAALIAIQARQRVNLVLALCCGVTSIWAGFGAFGAQPLLTGAVGLVDLTRSLVWYVYLLCIYHRSGVGAKWQLRGFGAVACAAFATGVTTAWLPGDSASYTLSSAPIAIRLLLGICELLLIENLYKNLPESARWHIAVPCVLLGGLACVDILLSADTALFSRQSASLTNGRTVAMIVIAPLLVLAALRGQRWSEPIRLSRSVVFHSATLVLSGSVLLALAFIGEILRHLDNNLGQAAEIGLLFSGAVSLMLMLSSRSARTFIDQSITYHFFADRFDYRMQWLKCISTLSGLRSEERTDLKVRAIRVIADVVNSPNGALFLKHEINDSLVWASSWNMPARSGLVLPQQPLLKAFNDQAVLEFDRVKADCREISDQLGPISLMIPLLHSNGMSGLVLVGPPRTAFRIDQEVFDLLGILGREVGAYLAEQRAIEVVTQTRSLHEYGTRFAFVAHDIKNVSSQLSLLLSNAEHYLDNPDFQHDMLKTVRASVGKIDHLLRRLDEPSVGATPTSTSLARLRSFLTGYQAANQLELIVNLDGTKSGIAICPEALDTILSHLLNNAVEAAPALPVYVRVGQTPERIIIDIIDRGEGMSAAFIQDELFCPFKTGKNGGSGIGAFQARELIVKAGGDLVVMSEPQAGTTMRILLSPADSEASARVEKQLSGAGA